MTNVVPPKRLSSSLEHIGLTECSDAESRENMSFALSRTQEGAGNLDRQILPQKNRTNAALLGAFTVHKKVLAYGVKANLQEAIEHKINKQSGKKIILALHFVDSYYCLETATFSYSQLMELKGQTHATDFFVVSREHDGLFAFFEDDPACLMSFADQEEFGSDFVDEKTANAIFQQHMMEWRINSLPTQSEWLEAIRLYISPQ